MCCYEIDSEMPAKKWCLRSGFDRNSYLRKWTLVFLALRSVLFSAGWFENSKSLFVVSLITSHMQKRLRDLFLFIPLRSLSAMHFTMEIILRWHSSLWAFPFLYFVIQASIESLYFNWNSSRIISAGFAHRWMVEAPSCLTNFSVVCVSVCAFEIISSGISSLWIRVVDR